MKSFLDCAIELGQLGFRVFPVRAHSKKPPLMKEFWKHAASDEATLRKLWRYDPVMDIGESFNPAIATDQVLALDADPKAGGFDTLEALQVIQGYELPDTYEQHTPSGGRHYVYTVPRPCAGSVSELGRGLDIRSHHGYILGAGAETPAGVYTSVIRPLAPAPQWLLEWAAAHPPGERAAPAVPVGAVDRRIALRRAHEYLAGLPSAPDRQRDASAYRAAAYLREIGLAEADAAEQMVLWFRFDGAFTSQEIEHAVHSAYLYATGAAGGASPEAYFGPVEEGERVNVLPEKPAGPPQESTSGDPRHLLNRNHAFIMVGNKARVMWEDKDHKGGPRREFLALEDFVAKNAGELMPSSDGKKLLEVPKEWLRWKYRRSYDSVVFAPGQKIPSRFYNTWQGFAYEPLIRGEVPTAGMKESLDMFSIHVRENLCGGNAEHARWLMGFFAHMVQRPQEKPLVAPVFKGGKGTGKSAACQRVGALLGPHFFVAPDQRYLLGNFNSHLNELLFFVLEEAVWGGSKAAEGMLKELVTGDKINIEQKFREVFRADNYMRIAIIGNESWQVPASLRDERRWNVHTAEMRSMPFETVADKKAVRRWFRRMRELMEQGGYRYLLTHLQGIDLEDVDLDEAPITAGLIEQIEHTLSPVHQWWLECLREGRIVDGDFMGGWPVDPEKHRMHDAFIRYCGRLNIGGRLPAATVIGRELHHVCPSVVLDKKNKENAWIYRLPPLPVAREEWAHMVGREVVWPDADDY